MSKGVLVVNDDEDMCELLCRVLQSTGSLVAYRAHSSDGALEELTEHQASINAVILDFTGGRPPASPCSSRSGGGPTSRTRR